MGWTERLLDFVRDFTTLFSLFYPLLYIRGFTRYSKAFKYFTLYLVQIAIVQFIMTTYKIPFLGESNLFMFFYFMMFQFISLTLFYKALLRFKFINYITIAVILFITGQYIIEPELYFRYNSYGIILTQLVLVFYSILYFYKSLTIKGEFVLVNSGLFIYLLSSTLIFASGNLVLDVNIPKNVTTTLNDVNTFLFLGFQVVIIIEWWRNYSFQKAD